MSGNLQITKYACEQLADAEIACVLINDEPWFRGNDVAEVLGYSRPRDAIRDHIPDKLRSKLWELINKGGSGISPLPDHNDLISTFINEAGLYKLIFRSKCPNAEIFTDWVCSGVLPSIRKHGSYTPPRLIDKQIKLLNETDLHYKVVDFIRNMLPNIRFIVPGLGEYQTKSWIKADAWKKGFLGGQPDILILNPSSSFNGFALELKNPNGHFEIRQNQYQYLEELKLCNFKTMISNDYDEIIITLNDYHRNIRIQCPKCIRKFKSKQSLDKHLLVFHRQPLPASSSSSSSSSSASIRSVT